ncbi:MAG: hypothetical protein ACM3QW_09070 [Ignavibacteriales bacterium]
MKGLRDLESVLTLDVLTALLNLNTIKLSQLNAAVSVLIKANIPFTLSFSPGTRRDEPEATLTVNINPHTSLQFIFEFDGDISI